MRHSLLLAALAAFVAALVTACPGADDEQKDDAGVTDAGVCVAGSVGCGCLDGGCDGALVCVDDVCVRDDGCVAGSVGCGCDNGVCDDGVCVADVCVAADCTAGAEGCACDRGACGTTLSGQPLSCAANNVCVSSRCTPGEPGCACVQGVGCDSGARCVDGVGGNVCLPEGCTAGTLGCGCAGGACNGGLSCFEGAVCVDNRGALGGACFDDGRCLAGNRCAANTCVPCTLGQQGCACAAGGDNDGCVEGLACSDGVCAATVGFANAAPEEPQCYTPCTGGGIQVFGAFRACPADGLMPGCLPGLSCVDGSCVVDGVTEAPQCDLHTNCPDFQACLGGRCVSNCETNADCSSVADCDRHVCRKRCTIVEDNCPVGSFCSTDDGEAGHCVEEVAPAGVDAAPVSDLLVSQTALVMSSSQTLASFSLFNASPETKHIVITKALERTSVDGVVQALRLGETKTERKNPAACTPGTLGCRCAAAADARCQTTSLGEPLTCTTDNLCALPTCTDGDAGCVCDADGSCGKVCSGADCPLAWLNLTARVGGDLVGESQEVALGFDVEAGDEVRIVVDNASGGGDAYYDGELVIDDGTTQARVQLSYARQPEGAWTGQMYTFGDFRVDEAGLANWMAKKDTGVVSADIAGIHNAFLQAWANFRRGNVSLEKFTALLTSTRTESWRSDDIVDRCGANKVCFPFLNDDGFDTYTFDPAGEPVPSGVVELPFGMNLAQASGTQFSGRVRTSAALHYGGDPAVTLQFKNDPATCSATNAAGCLVFVSSFEATSAVGGRYRGAACTAPRFETTRIPWLVPGFLDGTVTQNGRAFVQECRDTLTPKTVGDGAATENASLAGGNPLADGRERKRTITLVDGALINGDALFLIFKETTPALIGTSPADDLVAYGYLFLNREATVENAEDFVGNAPPQSLPPPPTLPALSCSAEINTLISGRPWDEQVQIVMGKPAVSSQVIIRSSTTTESTAEQAHYLCGDTKTFDTTAECPQGSPVTYFTVKAAQLSKAQVLADPCNESHTCDEALARYRREGRIQQEKAAWECEDGNVAYCSDDRFELRNAKRFFGQSSAPVAFEEIGVAIDDAFRFRTRFQDRAGKSIGFAPAICAESGGDDVPYCYDPQGIEELRERTNCLVSLYVNRPQNLTPAQVATRTVLEDHLRDSFSYDEVIDPTLNISVYHAGVEKLTAELLIMLGDDALTKALSSRFDLAGLQVASFPGDDLEPNGVRLSGVAGAEMALLYEATQYDAMVTDRFFELLPSIEAILDNDGGAHIIDQQSIETYFDRVIRASTQKARAWNEISKRYQNLGRPDLAKLVIERAYTAGTLESTVLTHLMLNIAKRSQVQFIDGILASIRRAQVSYSAALLDMSEQHRNIGDDVDYFGFPPDHIPFPAIETEASRDNGFEVSLNRAQQRLELARQAEEAALSTTRSFDTDAVNFQNELTRVENSYEAQLADLCGTFTVNGQVFPAIRKYAALDPTAQLFGDPCGRMGTGQIHQASGSIDLALVEMQRVRQSMTNLEKEIEIEEERIDAVCNTIGAMRAATVSLRSRQSDVQTEIADYQRGLATADRVFQAASTYSNLTKCTIGTSTDCVSAGVAAGLFTVALVANEAAQFAGSVKIGSLEKDLRDLQTQEATIGFDQQCSPDQTGQGISEIESKAAVARLVLRMSELQLDALREQYDLQQALSGQQQLRNQATRLQAEMDEVVQQTINVEAARNDPNVRIYKNDAVQTADTTFYSALREAFRATRVFEYHTSQSYVHAGDLLLARMVSRGDFNLQNYLIGLEDAYRDFEDAQGVPDLRVDVISLRDDILQIPRIGLSGEALSSAQRIDLLRERLAAPELLDENGYISVSFNTGPDDTSPLTRDHKIRRVEAEIVTTGSVDPLARVYLRAAGTSAVQGIDGELDFYALPKRTAVINAFFSGDKVYDPAVYQSFRFADRPLFNSRWDLILNTVDEPSNDDLRVEDLTDIRIYIYYSDFTVY